MPTFWINKEETMLSVRILGEKGNMQNIAEQLFEVEDPASYRPWIRGSAR
jgi:hypothetical protein